MTSSTPRRDFAFLVETCPLQLLADHGPTGTNASEFGGIVGTLCTDAAIGILACTVAAILLAKFDSTAARASEESMAPPVEER